MKKYSIEITAIDSECYIVETENLEEAIERAENQYKANGKDKR